MRSTHHTDWAAPRLRINLFGGVAIRVDGERITDLATRKAEALLIYLVCNPQPHQRETLADLLWDDLPADRAAGNLRLALNQLRKRFAPFLDITRQTIGVRPDIECWVDVQAFAQLVAVTSPNVDKLAEALALYEGEFLQGFHLREARGFSEWQATEAEHWQQQARTHMRTLVEAYIAHSNYTEALRWAARRLASDPLDEAAHREMMLLLVRSGQRTAAIRQYQACRQILERELGIDPETETEALYERICRMSDRRPHALPTRTRKLLGREVELARVYSWLAGSTSRLMSIIGPGGTGKTQLALNVGWRVVEEHLGPCSDGVFYIPLIVHDGSASPVDDVALVIAIAEKLQIRFAGKSSSLDQLIGQLRDKEALLIVDNGELLSPSARLALTMLIQHTQALRILVPSRERLKLRDEHVLDVSGLRYPSFPTRLVTPHQEQRLQTKLLDYPAVQLFLACVRQIQGDAFSSYTLQDQLAIGKICQIVHGLPLAIELVAPWARIRSPVEIVREITQAMDLLVVDLPDVPARHRSVRAVFEYSWHLITDQERQALARLAVFPASFTAEAAEAIAALTLHSLAALRDKSLIQPTTTDAGTRYVLHPFLRSLALEKLQSDTSSATTIYAIHASYFAAVAASYEEQLRSAQGSASLQALECEIDNLRAGWLWAVAAGDLATLGQYTIPLHDFCAIRGWELEGRDLFRRAAAVVHAWQANEATPETQLLAAARVLCCYAELEYILGAFDIAADSLQHSRMLLSLQALEDAPELMFIYKLLGLIRYWAGAYGDALSYLRLGLQMAEESGDTHKCADTLLAIGGVAYAQGEWSYAKEVIQRCHSIYQAQRYQWGLGHTLRFFGMIALAQDDRQAAHHYYQESLALAQQIGNRIGEALVYDQLGLMYLAEDQREQSKAAIQQGLVIFQDLGVDLGIARALGHLGRVAIAQENYDVAQQYYWQAIQIAQQVQASPLLIESAAGALHCCLHTLGNDGGEAALQALLRSLLQHPACTADVKHYITLLLGDEPLLAAEPAQQGDLDSILMTISARLTRTDQPQLWSIQRAL